MKSSDESISTQYTERLELTQEIKEELIEALSNLSYISKIKPNFLKELLNKCILVGKYPWTDSKAIFFDDIEHFIQSEYKNTKDSLYITKNARLLTNHLCFKSDTIKSYMINCPVEDKIKFRKYLEKELVLQSNNFNIQLEDIILIGGCDNNDEI